MRLAERAGLQQLLHERLSVSSKNAATKAGVRVRRHDRHRRVIAELKSGPLAHAPSGKVDAKSA